MTSQPQLLQMALKPRDVIYTPDRIAKYLVDFFSPSGRILEPCKGDGSFLKYLPSAEWCEIAEGKDFFQWHEAVDWCFGNPPYGLFSEWLGQDRHETCLVPRPSRPPALRPKQDTATTGDKMRCYRD